MTDLIEQLIKPRVKDLGDGFKVRRILPFHSRRMVGPFIFFDHFGPVDYAPGQGFDVRPHPHIGLATVTFMFEGAIHHRDSLGNDLIIRPGAINWMTTGRGICHSERTPDAERAKGQSMHGIQTWVALPQDHAEDEPAFIHHPADTLPRFDLGGANARVLAGSAFGHDAPVQYPWDIWYVGAEAQAGADFMIGAHEAQERALYVASGSARIGDAPVQTGEMAVLAPGKDVPVTTAPNTRFMLAGGAPMDGPRMVDWNFVASSAERLEKARADWRMSAASNWKDTPFTLPNGEHDFIPYPGD